MFRASRIGRTLGIAAAGAVLCSLSFQPAAAAKRALLIGISAYENIRPLNGPRRDLPKMKAFLRDHWKFAEDEIIVLEDADATRDKIISAIKDKLISETESGDRVLIYFSGHGSQLPDEDGDEEDGLDETLSPVNTTEDGRNQITDDVFGALLAQLGDRRVTVIIDSCHSGTVSRSVGTFTEDEHSGSIARTFVPTLQSRSATPTVYDEDAHSREESFVKSKGSLHVWSAAASNQLSWDTPRGGVFTGHFIEGMSAQLADNNKNGTITNSELLVYVRGKTKAYCSKNPICRGFGFTPTLEADSKAMEVVAVPLRDDDEEEDAEDENQESGEKEEEETDVAEAEDEDDEEEDVDITDLIVQDNDANVAIDILPKDVVNAGESIQFRVTSERPGHLILLDINADGEVVQLVPNEIMDKHKRTSEVGPKVPITIPDAYYGFKFTASEPYGEGILVAIVTEDKLKIDELLDANRAISVVAKPNAYLTQLASSLLKVWNDDKKNRELKWSLATRKYTIKE